MNFLTGTTLTSAIRQITETQPVAMAVAFWGGDAIDLLSLPSNLAGYRIACDAFSGACNPKAMAELFHRGAEVRDVPGLHAKVYLSPSAMVVTSANASTNGLSEDGIDPGLEAGILVTAAEERTRALLWFDTLFLRGRSLGAEDLPELSRLWKTRRTVRPMRMTLAQAILTNDPTLADRKIKAYLYDAEEPSKAVQKRFKDSHFFDSAIWENDGYPFFWGDLPEAPPGTELLCFEIDGAKVRYENIWLILAVMKEKEPAIWPAVEIARTLGVSKRDMKTVAKRVARALEAGRLDSDAAPISLVDFATALVEPLPEDHLARIVAEPARTAYRYLGEHLHTLGLERSYKTGRVPAVKLKDWAGRYILSYIPNQAHLLFYVRRPALNARPGLAQAAIDAGLPVQFNSAGEATIRLETKADAERLFDWLGSVLPLP